MIYSIVQDKKPVAVRNSLQESFDLLKTLPPGLYTIRFVVNGEQIDLQRHTWNVDRTFSIRTLN